MYMTTDFKLSAPLAVDPEVMLTSCYGQLACALGKMTGAMMPDGAIVDSSNCGVSLMTLQAIFTEAGVEALVMGACQSIDSASSFVAMTDASIWRVALSIIGGELVTKGYKADKEEILKDCLGLDELSDFVKVIVADALNEGGRVDLGDAVTGHVLTDAHAAICLRVNCKGKFIVHIGETQAVRCGIDFIVDCPTPNADADTIAKYVKIREMTAEEVAEEQSSSKAAFGVTNPFPMKVGNA
jgi:hypothetical protein